MVAAAQAEEKERQQVQEEIGEVEQHLVAILPMLDACSDPRKQQVRLGFLLYSANVRICRKADTNYYERKKYDILYVSKNHREKLFFYFY